MTTAVVPLRDRILDLAPGFLRSGTGERWLYRFGLALDAVMERRFQSTLAHFPLRGVGAFLSGGGTGALSGGGADMLDVIGADRLVLRGLTESDFSYGTRLHVALDAHALDGSARAVLSQCLGYLLAMTPLVRAVSSTYDPSTWPPTRAASQWDSYPVGRSLYAEPVHLEVTASGGNMDWDSLSPVTGSWGWWGVFLVFYPIAPNDFAHVDDAWGDSGTYTPSGARYSKTLSGQRVPAGTFTGGTGTWGDGGGTYTAPSSGRYSQTVAGQRAPAGTFTNGGAWGIAEGVTIGRSFQIIAGQFKSANTWIRSIIFCFDATLFDPAQTADGTHNPAGTFGRWSKTVSGQRVGSRFASARYGGEVV